MDYIFDGEDRYLDTNSCLEVHETFLGQLVRVFVSKDEAYLYAVVITMLEYSFWFFQPQKCSLSAESYLELGYFYFILLFFHLGSTSIPTLLNNRPKYDQRVFNCLDVMKNYYMKIQVSKLELKDTLRQKTLKNSNLYTVL